MGKAKAQKGKCKKSKPEKGANGKPVLVPSGAAALGLEILTLEEAAALLRVPADVLRAEAEGENVPARKVGGEWRFYTHALRDWLTHPQPIRVRASDLGPPVGMGRIVKAMPGRRNLADLPMPDITEEEYAAFRATLDAQRDEVDRITKSGKYAEDE